jgi:hypothetical protein
MNYAHPYITLFCPLRVTSKSPKQKQDLNTTRYFHASWQNTQ